MVDTLWLIISALLIFCMQAGFLCLESGKTRSKNNINVAAKNIIDFIISISIFWCVGFGLMFGTSISGLFGNSHFLFGDSQSPTDITFFFFQMMFCGTAATLMSGAVAERMSFFGYVALTIILSAAIYPIVGHWVWGGVFLSINSGWLELKGSVDFAGSTVVHSVGGWVALVAVIIIGPRYKRFDRQYKFPSGSSLPMASLGVFLIWFGWFGFNAGSTLAFNDQVPLILLNTSLAAAWGGLVVTFIHYLHNKYMNISFCLNGILAGLVGITASCYAVSPVEAVAIGAVSGIIMFYGDLLLRKLRIDDALSVVPVHLFAGIWGTLAVAIFGDPTVLDTGLSFSQQLWIQVVGIVSIGTYCTTVSYILFKLINIIVPLRVSLADEVRGLNIAEHHASNELVNLLAEMEVQQNQGDFTSPVEEEPFTEVGQIAQKYNQVISRVSKEMNERDKAIKRFQVSEKRKSVILDSSIDSIVSIDFKGNIIEFNPSAERIFGVLKKNVLGQPFFNLFMLEEHKSAAIDSLKHAFSLANTLVLNRRSTLDIRRVSGETFPAEITITSAQLGSKYTIEYTLHIRDVAREVKLQSRLHFLAYKDALTGLSNRTHMMKELNSSIKYCKKQLFSVALYFLDLDKFKKINDTLGHKAGDQLLCEVAARLTQLARSTDVIARWGGDEFVFIMSGKLTQPLIIKKAESILQEMRKPIKILEELYTIPTSIGIAVSSNGDVEGDVLIQQADIAMYKAKDNGRDNYQLYTAEMGRAAARVLSYEQEIKQAIIAEQFYLDYQPKVNSQNEIIGFEALIRWLHPQKGLVSPAEFIPIAEESHLIIDIGKWVVKEALKQQKEWIDLGLSVKPVSVNISGDHLMSEGFISFIKASLADYQIDGRLLEIEITEGVLINEIERCIEVLTVVKSLGVHIAIDDFGTGYSSLNYLRRLPLDILKIDQAFVRECNAIEEDREICAAIINLALGMRLSVIAEGVETKAQVETLMSLGCHNFQGFYYHKPLTKEKITDLLIQPNNEQEKNENYSSRNQTTYEPYSQT
ncbi:MAG: ammonium transporter [Colwellia sp.]|nr:ammonium transporter [Colwellia sp.]